MRGFRLGVVGPGSPFGQRVRALLGEGELPLTELKLFESETLGGVTLSQFGDDVVVTQALDPDLFPHLDALFFAGGDNDVLNRMAHRAAEEGVLTLVEGAVGLGAPVVTPDEVEELRSGAGRLGIVPRAASYLVGTTLAAVARSYEIDRAVATVLVPAQELGDPGAEELHQQIVHILNFKSPPTDVFREQLAFNVKPAGSSVEAGLAVSDSVAWEASQLAGVEGVLTVSLVQVPVFHGYSAAIWVETREEVDPKSLRARFRAEPFETPGSARGARPPSPVSIAGSESIHVGPLRGTRSSGPKGTWLWAVADTTAYDPAAAAVAIARALLS